MVLITSVPGHCLSFTFNKPNFSNRANSIINFKRLFPNFIVATMNWFWNSLPG